MPNLCDGIDESVSDCKTDEMCDVKCEMCKRTCLVSTQVCLPFKKERQRASRLLEIIHTDVCGPVEPATHDQKNYFVTFLDDYARFCVVYLLRNKSEVEKYVRKFVAQAESRFNMKVSKICDNYGEYRSSELIK
jgi:hypothetical protein